MDQFPRTPRTFGEVATAFQRLWNSLTKFLRPSGDILVDTQSSNPPASTDRGIVLKADDGEYVRVTATYVGPGNYTLTVTEIGTTRP